MSDEARLSVISEHIVATPDVCGGKPRIANTRIRVQDIYVWHEVRGLSPKEILAQFPHITLADIHAALAYYHDHPEAIQREMKEAEELVERLKTEQGPSPLDQLRAKNANSVPPG